MQGWCFKLGMVHHDELGGRQTVLVKDHFGHHLIQTQGVGQGTRTHIRDSDHFQNRGDVSVARLPLDAILYWEAYDPADEAGHLEKYDQEMIDTGIYSGRQVSDADPIPADQYGWTEHSARRVSQVLRPHLREVLDETGFELK